MNEGRRECPICRQSFNTCVPDENMAYLITHTFTQCPACHLTVSFLCQLFVSYLFFCVKKLYLMCYILYFMLFIRKNFYHMAGSMQFNEETCELM